jgi:ABC-type lipoprotein export system ATPase subunit
MTAVSLQAVYLWYGQFAVETRQMMAGREKADFHSGSIKEETDMLYVKELFKSYEAGKNKYEVLKGIDFHVAQGEFVAVMGPSGSGKTTLLNCISCYIPFDKGNIKLGGVELAGMNEEELARVRNTKIGFVFQDFMLLDGLTIRENILVPRIVQGEVPGEAEKLADQLAAMFGIGHILNKYPAEISGGEKQRAAVARSLINNPLIILADEPTGNLDSKSSRAVIETFINAKQKMNATIFMVTHDSFAASFCDRVILLKDGTIYRQMEKWEDRSVFQDQLLDAIKQMSE